MFYVKSFAELVSQTFFCYRSNHGLIAPRHC